ncbi:hypothetical protein [Shewanella surugensis]|uniref:Uncharacterized protein n=1 Tax=Shewanella surugensis TaxID=212020 RepID=A0ABT0LFM7_9GAMM|nr:hypothetical protein [Shewanella surugensis]MCL1126521.1 hypothetical protein [Shewanella surugensis]
MTIQLNNISDISGYQTDTLRADFTMQTLNGEVSIDQSKIEFKGKTYNITKLDTGEFKVERDRSSEGNNEIKWNSFTDFFSRGFTTTTRAESLTTLINEKANMESEPREAVVNRAKANMDNMPKSQRDHLCLTHVFARLNEDLNSQGIIAAPKGIVAIVQGQKGAVEDPRREAAFQKAANQILNNQQEYGIRTDMKELKEVWDNPTSFIHRDLEGGMKNLVPKPTLGEYYAYGDQLAQKYTGNMLGDVVSSLDRFDHIKSTAKDVQVANEYRRDEMEALMHLI